MSRPTSALSIPSVRAAVRSNRPVAGVAALAAAFVISGGVATASNDAEGGFAQLSATIAGATIEPVSEFGGPEQITFFNGARGQDVNSNSQFTVTANGGSLSMMRYGRMFLQPGISLEYFVDEGSSQPQLWTANHRAGGAFTDTVTFSWAEGFDPSQPIPVLVRRRVTVPEDIQLDLTIFDNVMIDGNIRAEVEAGYVSGPSTIVLSYSANKNSLATAPRLVSDEVVVSDGGVIRLSANVLNRADASVRWFPDDPNFNIPSARSGIPVWVTMWVEVPAGVEVAGLSNNDWAIELPATSCQADLNVDAVVDFSDLLVVLSNFGEDFLGDANADGGTDFADVLAILSQFGAGCSPSGS